jgi:hypothetical protein
MDSGNTDSTTPADVSMPTTDSQTPTQEAGEDTGPGNLKDAGDAGDTGTSPTSEAGPDGEAGVALTLTTFPGMVAAALCNRFENCCPAPEAGKIFDTNGCIQRFINNGYSGSLTGQSLIDGGHVTFNLAQAQSCLSQIAAIDCSANLRTSAQEEAILAACYGALSGTLAAGAPCTDPIECAPGQFCDPKDAGDGSVCAPLRTAGESCADFGSTNYAGSDTACSYRGSGSTGLTCKNGDFNTYGTLPLSQWVCATEQPLDGGCFVNVDCNSKLCDPLSAKCAPSETFIYPFACTFDIPAPVEAGVDSGHD